ncbi:hypothetical protein Q7C36_005814 [Tachysurus vachellii]|uniref:Uncharacterized protein n=1 Tax=Tachysurus vachellii TaxID=175792 RepID=A0AA88NEK4_TACVA|nr:hypothetical protein Q7C36_005814 [Tachysurus vachellii]
MEGNSLPSSQGEVDFLGHTETSLPEDPAAVLHLATQLKPTQELATALQSLQGATAAPSPQPPAMTPPTAAYTAF